MKKNYFTFFLFFLLSLLFFNCNDDENFTKLESTNLKSNNITIKDVNNNIVNEIPSEIYTLILRDLKRGGDQKRITYLQEQFKLDKKTNSYILENTVNSKNFNISTSSMSSTINNFMYKSHLGGTGWTGFSSLGHQTGTTGQSWAIEALQFSANIYIPNFRARGHVQGTGWLPYVGFGETVGTTGQRRQLEAVQIDVPTNYATNVYYRTHVKNLGWLPYVGNNEISGTVGKSLRIEAFQMHMYIIE